MMEGIPLYRQIADHYRSAIIAGTLRPGDRLMSLRSLMKRHQFSLSTALQVCRTLESEGWLQAREREGYFVQKPARQRASAQGSAGFREAIARRALNAAMALSPSEILPTQGCTEALNLALRAVAGAGDVIAVESPTFYGLLQVLESLGMQALEIPTSPRTGISLDALEMAIAAYPRMKALVLIPHLQNPLGSVMPETHKVRLLELAGSNDIAVIEDDTYSELLETTCSKWRSNAISPSRPERSFQIRIEAGTV